MITTLCTLITGLDTTYSGPVDRNKLNDQSSSSDEGLDLDLQSSEQALQQPSDTQSGSSNQDTAASLSPTKNLESEEAEDGNKLKTVIDACGCWNLRVSSLDEKWPCLLVYCAKSKDIWRNAFKRISKLEKSCFLRRKISDSIQNVDMRNLEYFVESYGQKYALGPRIPPRNVCVSLCAQPPSSPENPSVGICGIEANVEEVYSILVQRHLVPDDVVDSLSTPRFSSQDSSARWKQGSPVDYYASNGQLSPSYYYY